MPICLFCDSSLNENTKPEHILLNAFGGRKTTRRADCSSCNGTFGSTIDDEFASQVIPLRNLMQFRSGDGDLAPTLKNVQSGEDRINIKGDGAIRRIVKPFTVGQLEDGKWDLHVEVQTPDELARIIPHISAQLGIPEQSLRDQLFAAQGSVVNKRPGPIAFQPKLGGPNAIRSMVKAALVLWSTVVGNDEVKGPAYDAARNFVVRGDSQFNGQRTRLDSRALPEIAKMKDEYGPLFNLIYVRSDAAGRVVGHFTLYNLVAWHLTLAEEGGKPNEKVALISNPEDPSKWSDQAAELFDVNFEWLNSPAYTLAQSKDRLDAMMLRYFEVNNPKEYGRIVEACFRQLGLEPNVAVPQEKVPELSSLIGLRAACHAAGLPYEQTITPELMAEILKA